VVGQCSGKGIVTAGFDASLGGWPVIKRPLAEVTRIASTRGDTEPDRHLDVRGQPATSVRGEMLLVSLDSQISSLDRDTVDAEARTIVLDAYRSAAISMKDPLGEFDAALESYCKAYPHISRPLARHAVAHIIGTDGM
jgi:hypothetical protein